MYKTTEIIKWLITEVHTSFEIDSIETLTEDMLNEEQPCGERKMYGVYDTYDSASDIIELLHPVTTVKGHTVEMLSYEIERISCDACNDLLANDYDMWSTIDGEVLMSFEPIVIKED